MDIFSVIDIDETGFYVKGLAKKSGQAHTSCWVHHLAHYCRGDPKLNLITSVALGYLHLPPGVDGRIQKPRCWVHILQINCNQYVFDHFVESILSDLEKFRY